MSTEIKFCKCGSAMSNYESEMHGECSGCKNQRLIQEQIKRNNEVEQKRIELEEQKKRDEEEQLRKKQEHRKNYNLRFEKLIGKTIERVELYQWKDVFGEEKPTKAALYFTDGSDMSFVQEEDSDGCRGCYDYEQYLDFELWNIDNTDETDD